MAAHVGDTLKILLARFQGLTITEPEVERLLATLVEGVVSWQLTNSETWGEAESARRPWLEVLARNVVGQARDEVRRVLLGIPRN